MAIKIVRSELPPNRNKRKETSRDHRGAGSGQIQRGSNWWSALPTKEESRISTKEMRDSVI